ncbi:MAG: hypothetical protein WC828_06120 [Thermoleophilia bacterium]|jgi:hypothetical protein
MARYGESFSLNLSVPIVTNACHEAFREIGWPAKQSTTGFVFKEPFKLKLSQLLILKYPATVRVDLAAESQNSTLVNLRGSNFGFGPVQSNHVRKQVDDIREAIRRQTGQP